jgi:urease alpha subunit
LPPEHIIQWVTSTPARALGLDDRIGTLAPGRNADVVIWSGNPFSIYTKADQVFIDGALAYDRSKPRGAPGPDLLLGRPEAGAGERAGGRPVVPEQEGEGDTAGVRP